MQKGIPTCTLQRQRILPARVRYARPVVVASAAPAEAHTLDAQVAVVLGTQWGDEGKGKLVDILAQQYDIVARAQVYSSPLVHPRLSTLEAFTKNLKKYSKCDQEMDELSTLRAFRKVFWVPHAQEYQGCGSQGEHMPGPYHPDNSER